MNNGIEYRNYHIYFNTYIGPGCDTVAYCFAHNDYDGAPDAHDHRNGACATIDECKAEIDYLEDEKESN